MIRKALVIWLNAHKTVCICVDQQRHDILQYILNDDSILKEFSLIKNLLFENQRNRERYCKVDVSKKAHDIYEMRFINNGRNDRIYCKEIRSTARFIIIADLFIGKKSQNIPKQIIPRIENIGGNNYEIIK